ncbi:hypothetical protein QFC21_005809 [Naganishia friedmannii]|uniref:Uncharacterized protein n=1 Tax=Naganishia friedmannii TaxID=89922 RepID=A0ACC2V7G9_9TREE|nr:hypothetical protein QFC21_005809 [Naganishia friedmannii]
MRYKQEFQICCGLVPGTKNDKDGKFLFDSFLQPLIEDFKVLATEGIEAFQHEEESASLQPFTLRGHLLTVTGNMPAVSKAPISSIPADTAG